MNPGELQIILLDMKAISFFKDFSKCNAKQSKEAPVAVVIMGKYDATELLCGSAQSLLLQIAKTHRVVLKSIGDASLFGKNIRESCSELGKKASLLVVLSHGRSDFFRFGEDVPWYKFGWIKRPLFRKEDVHPEDFSMLTPDAKIILLSCASAKGIAKVLSIVSKRVVFAATEMLRTVDTCFCNWPNPEICVLSYNEKNEQHMNVFDPFSSSISIPSCAMNSEETNNSFCEMESYLRQKAEAGDTNAQVKLGVFYLRVHKGYENQEKMALHWITIAANHGHSEAQYTLGIFYLFGQGGIEQSEEKALEWFQRSATQECTQALFHLGVSFYQGKLGLQQSDEEAFKFFSHATKKLMPQASYFLGLMYELGRGVPRSLRQAKEHYKIASEFEVFNAKYRLSSILFQEEQRLLSGNYVYQKTYALAIEYFDRIREIASNIYCTRNHLRLVSMDSFRVLLRGGRKERLA
jgi:tetratricopeptide (TPR) repeat protein